MQAPYPCMVFVKQWVRRVDSDGNTQNHYGLTMDYGVCADDESMARFVASARRTAEEGWSCVLMVNGEAVCRYRAKPTAWTPPVHEVEEIR
jgi:hypothetical protein